ncbi:MAG: hypothetical protein J5911_04935 [Clostridia bacterium]|nr:hypothetical protein [Clostridia bacterium]
MSRRTNFINNIILLALTVGGFAAVVLMANGLWNESLGMVLLYVVCGAVVAGFFSTLCHELGHLVSGKINGFAFISMTVWFFKWSKERNKIVFDFVMVGEEAGCTEMAPESVDNLPERLKKMTLGGLFATLIPIAVGIIPFFIAQKLSLFLFVVWAMFLPIGIYCFFGNALPISSGGAGNDGRVLYGLKKMDDDTKVIINLLKIQSELFNGKMPAEIDEKYYFDLPQLAEDDLNFIILLFSRYDYYLDKKDYEGAKKVSDRLLTLIEYMPKSFVNTAKANALYNACSFDKNEDKADDLTYEIEKFLNKGYGSVEIRAKIAYILYIKQEKEVLDAFYADGVKAANKCPLRGVGLFERKLLEEMKKDF